MENDTAPTVILDTRAGRLEPPPGAPFPFQPPNVVHAGEGIVALWGAGAALYRGIDREIQTLARKLGAEEIVLPSSLEVEDYRKSGYLDRFPQFTTSLSTGRVCTSAVCLPSYPRFRDQTFEPSQGIALTATGRAFRKEVLTGEEPERLREYSAREIIFLGSDEYVDLQLGKCLEWMKEFLVACKVPGIIQSAEDPFFCSDAGVLKAYQRATQSKYELQLKRPESQRLVAVGSVNRHGAVFSKAFNIRFRSGDYIQSGCLAVGIERVLLMVAAFYGFDQSRWPETLRARLGS